MDIEFDDENAREFVSSREIDSLQANVDHLHADLEKGTGRGSDHLGWLHLPSQTPTSLLDSIYSTQKEIRDQCNTIVCVGIGGF